MTEFDTLGLAKLIETLNEPCECERGSRGDYRCEAHGRPDRWWLDPGSPLRDPAFSTARAERAARKAENKLIALGIAGGTRRQMERQLRALRDQVIAKQAHRCNRCFRKLEHGLVLVSTRPGDARLEALCRRCRALIGIRPLTPSVVFGDRRAS